MTMPETLSAYSWLTAALFLLTVLLVVRPLVIPLPRALCGALHRRGVKSVSIGFVAAPIGAVLVLLASQAMLPSEAWRAIQGTKFLQPYSIVILFFSLAYLSVSLDVSGLLVWLSLSVVARAGSSGRRLFFAFFAISSVLTIFTSNDIVIMTLTPIVIYACQFCNVDPMPYLYAEFTAANVWSSLFYTGNPTNIIVANANSLNFVEYARYAALPTLGAGLTLLLMLGIVFWRKVPHTIVPPKFDTAGALKSKLSASVGSLLMVASLVALVVSSFFDVPVWIVTLPFAIAMLLKDVALDLTGRSGAPATTMAPDGDGGAAHKFCALPTDETSINNPVLLHDAAADHHDDDEVLVAAAGAGGDAVVASEQPAAAVADEAAPRFALLVAFERRLPTLYAVLARQPWALAPFVVCMFILVEALVKHGWTTLLAQALSGAIGPSVMLASFVVGSVSALACNVVNNQPATIFLTRVLDDAAFDVTPPAKRAAQFALALASNYGANLTLIGALAGLMWNKVIVSKQLPAVSYFAFARVGFVTTIPLLVVSFALLGATI